MEEHDSHKIWGTSGYQRMTGITSNFVKSRMVCTLSSIICSRSQHYQRWPVQNASTYQLFRFGSTNAVEFDSCIRSESALLSFIQAFSLTWAPPWPCTTSLDSLEDFQSQCNCPKLMEINRAELYELTEQGVCSNQTHVWHVGSIVIIDCGVSDIISWRKCQSWFPEEPAKHRH